MSPILGLNRFRFSVQTEDSKEIRPFLCDFGHFLLRFGLMVGSSGFALGSVRFTLGLNW